MKITLKAALATVGASAAILAVAPVAHADDAMYRVGTDIMPGDYQYVINDSDWGSYRICATASCNPGGGVIDMSGPIDGYGQVGWLTVPADAKYVKTINLSLTPA
jgi:hypothetical protein